MELASALIALENKIFFGSDVVVEAGFRQSEFVGHICERRRGTLGVKEFRRARQNMARFAWCCAPRLKGEPVWNSTGDVILSAMCSN